MIKPKLNLTFVRTPKPSPTDPATSDKVAVDYAQIVRESIATVAKYGAIAVVGYVVLDTGRQCAVKATPSR